LIWVIDGGIVFERRLKIFMGVLMLVTLMLLSRVFEVQVVAHSYWSKQAAGMLTKPQITETTRGRILDVRGKPLAIDTACTDACVDYRAIIDPPDADWLRQIVIARLRTKFGRDYTSAKSEQKKSMQADEKKLALADINTMWETLAELNPQTDPSANPRAAVEEIRKGIIQSVNMRRHWFANRLEQQDEKRTSARSKLMRWLAGPATDLSGDDNVGVIEDQQEPHVVLPALDSDACNFLGKRLDQFPGLMLRPSTHRTYPLKTVACHLLGNLSRVSAADLEEAKRSNLDELRQYLPNDVIGRNGIESLCEPLLRGTRGKIETRLSDKQIIAQQDFIPGSDVQLSIDSDLQAQAQDLLQHVTEHVLDDNKQRVLATPEDGVSMHGAVVVLDIKTNEVRVLASNPGFDLNELQDRYAALAGDELNEPLTDRATSDTCEPGSTVKPMIGMSAITQGVLAPTEPISCAGVLYLPEMDARGVVHPERVPGAARCWILSEYPHLGDYLRGHGGKNPPEAQHGPLDFADALERSCDCFFETAADRLTPAGVDSWMSKFGLGRPTGIGIFERSGMRPDMYHGNVEYPRANNCLAGMGQGTVLATPLQIANEAATIARGGIWMRPRLLTADSQAALDAVHPRNTDGDVVDLHLNPQAVKQAHLGMVNVVEAGPGTGKIEHTGFTLAAKTGTADTASIWIKSKDETGKIVSEKLMPVHRGEDEGATPWYRSGNASGYGVVHSWYMGYAPAENPQVAFCVLIEYAGAGGSLAAGPVASHMLEDCIRAGYLRGN
jgi:penicillin-binding protein 2